MTGNKKNLTLIWIFQKNYLMFAPDYYNIKFLGQNL